MCCAFYLRDGPVLSYTFWRDSTLAMGPYGSTGTCIINYIPIKINVVIIAKALFITMSTG